MMKLKPGESLLVAVLTALGVFMIFQHNTPNLADVKASMPGGAASLNTHKSIKTAVYESAALVVGVAVLAKDPTVYVVGGLVTAVEGWKYYHANSTGIATPAGQAVAPGANVTGQPTPTLNSPGS
jgi:hypothetical protein